MSAEKKLPRQYFGSAAHLIVSSRCHFHIATQIGDVLISTVGEYFQREEDEKPTTIGYDRLYETMVFRVAGACECGCGLPTHSGSEIDFAAYNTPTDANAGHELMCERWAHGSVASTELVDDDGAEDGV